MYLLRILIVKILPFSDKIIHKEGFHLKKNKRVLSYVLIETKIVIEREFFSKIQ